MRDRKLRAVIGFAAIAGTIITLVTLWMYLNSSLPAWSLVLIMVVYSIIQIKTAKFLYKKVYESKYLDIPAKLKNQFPPIGYEYLSAQGGDTYDVILLRPPSAILSGPDCGEALGLGYLASELRSNGYKVLFVDARLMGLDTMQTVELLTMYTAPMLGINLNFQYLAESTIQLIEALNERGFTSHITVGGLFASVAATELMEKMPLIDTVVRFEGEKTYLELIRSINEPARWSDIDGLIYRREDGTVITNPLRTLIKNISQIPFPARDFLPISVAMGGYAYVVSSRGCHGACSYCVQQRSTSDPQGNRWRCRDADNVVNEVVKLNREYDADKFSFVDDDFFGSKHQGKTHAHRVAEALIERKLNLSILLSIQPQDVDHETFALLKQAGIDSVILAVDNFSQPVLDRYRKISDVEQNLKSIEILKNLGIDAYLGIIIFDPWVTLDEIAENLNHMGEMPFLRPWQILSKLEIYKGSPMTLDLEEKGLIEWENFGAKYQFLDERISGVYKSIETIMKIIHPSMMQLDLFRWGNLKYSETDAYIIEHLSEELDELNQEFNRQAIQMALEIVTRQNQSPDPIALKRLADQKMQTLADALNNDTLRNISLLRRNAFSQMEHNAEEVSLASTIA